METIDKKYDDERMGKNYIGKHLKHLEATGHSERTIEARGYVLRALHNHLPRGLVRARTEQIEAWLATPGWSRWTRVTYTRHVRGFYSWATKAHLLDGDPTGDFPKQRPPRCVPNPCTDEELALAMTSPEPWYSAVVLAAYAGLRASEIAALQRADIREDLVWVARGKGGHPGAVPCHPIIWDTFKCRPEGHVILGPRGPIKGPWLSSRQREHFDRMGLFDLYLHRLRHWYGTRVQELNGDIRVTQECLRHSSVSSTQIYTKVSGRRLVAAVAALPIPGVPASQ